MENKKTQKKFLSYENFLLMIFTLIGGFLAINIEKLDFFSEFSKWERRGISLLFIAIYIILFHFIFKLLTQKK
jgi:hypothetical protein